MSPKTIELIESLLEASREVIGAWDNHGTMTVAPKYIDAIQRSSDLLREHIKKGDSDAR